MSTRAQVIVSGGYSEVWFYRHSDGYPEGTLPSLRKFMRWAKEGLIRDNAEQASGWLVIIGAEEYNVDYSNYDPRTGEVEQLPCEEMLAPTRTAGGWKVGSYEPCAPEKHGDIEYLYRLDLEQKTIYCEGHGSMGYFDVDSDEVPSHAS